MARTPVTVKMIGVLMRKLDSIAGLLQELVKEG